ncbi:hypothetical protein AAG570_013004, partial [Ranatra chinensis]
KFKCHPREALRSTVPAVHWLANYKWKEWLIKDIIAGCTVAVMNIPQGMAYALLGNVPPVVGIYMAFFPVLIYSILGTSRHISMGSFAVVCLMAGKVVLTQTSIAASNLNNTLSDKHTFYSPIEVGTAVTFMVAIFQLVMYLFRLGIVCTLLSDTLISGFTAGASIHVFTSQIKDLLGMKVPRFSGSFQIINTYIGIFSNLDTINVAAVVVSIVTISILLINNELLKPWVSKRSIVPIPIELIAVLTGTLLSAYCGLSERYNLKTVGPIAVGLPEPKLPPIQLLSSVAIDSFVIAIIAYIISVSMALIFANKLKYEIDANQELLAQGCGNFFGSFFSCLPFAASLSRSVIQQTVGGCTQLTSIVSSLILLIVLLWIAPFFEPLPRCILSSLIVVALKGVILQALDIRKIWRTSPLDGIVWLSTYIGVVLVEIDVGLLIGVCASVLTLLIRGMRSTTCIVERLPNTDIYVDTNRYAKTEDLPGITVIRYSGCINFLNRTYFKKDIFRLANKVPINNTKKNKVDAGNIPPLEILDFTGLQYVDPSGAACLKCLIQEMSNLSVSVYMAGISGSVISMLQTCDVLSASCPYFPTVHDAVIYSQSKQEEPVYTIRL